MTGTAFAAEDRHKAALARFAYVNTAVFERSLGVAPARPTLEPAVPESESAVAGDAAEFRPVLLVAAETSVDHPVAPVESARALPADVIETIGIVRDVEPVAPTPRAEQRVALLEPAAHLAGLAPEEVLTARPEHPVHAPRMFKRKRMHTHANTARPALRKSRSANKAAKKVASAGGKVPRWAKQMFESTWQDHAFAYQ